MTDTQADLTERARAREDGSVYVTLTNLPGFHFIMAPGEGVTPLLEALDQFVALYRQSEREDAAAEAWEKAALWWKSAFAAIASPPAPRRRRGDTLHH